MKLTEWFPGSIKPARKGVYQRQLPQQGISYARWNGEYWLRAVPWLLPRPAWERQNRKPAALSFNQDAPWRGVTSKPRGSK
jgi:hypothetical protein